MTSPIEERPSANEKEQQRTAFGIALLIDPRISIPGLAPRSDPQSTGAPSHLRLDDGELDRR